MSDKYVTKSDFQKSLEELRLSVEKKAADELKRHQEQEDKFVARFEKRFDVLEKNIGDLVEGMTGNIKNGTTGFIGRIKNLEAKIIPIPRAAQYLLLAGVVFSAVATSCSSFVKQFVEKPPVEACVEDVREVEDDRR